MSKYVGKTRFYLHIKYHNDSDWLIVFYIHIKSKMYEQTVDSAKNRIKVRVPLRDRKRGRWPRSANAIDELRLRSHRLSIFWTILRHDRE